MIKRLILKPLLLSLFWIGGSWGSELATTIKELVSVETGVPPDRLFLGTIDRRLNIDKCSTGLTIQFPFPKSRETVKVLCSEPRFNIFLSVRYEQILKEPVPEKRQGARDGRWIVTQEIKSGEMIAPTQIEYHSEKSSLGPLSRHPLGKFATNPTLQILALKDFSPGQAISFGDFKASILIPKIAQDIGIKAIITESMLTDERADISSIQGNVALDKSEILNRETVRPLRRGQRITLTSLREAKLVVKNQPVILLIKSGALEIRASAIAVESGILGETVRVVSAESGKIIVGEVLGRNLVGIQKNN